MNRKTRVTVSAGSHTLSLGLARNLIPTSISNTTTIIEAANAKPTDGISGRLGGTISNTPIAPEYSNSGEVFRLLLLVLVAAVLVYFFSIRLSATVRGTRFSVSMDLHSQRPGYSPR